MMDKLLHAETGLIITLIFSIIHPILGVLAGMFLGIGKEVYDWFDYGEDIGFRLYVMSLNKKDFLMLSFQRRYKCGRKLKF